MFHRIIPLLCVLLFSFSASACDSCGCNFGDPARGGGSGITAGVGNLRKEFSEFLRSKSPETADAVKPPETPLAGGMPDVTQEPEAPKLRRWSLDTSFEYRNFKRPNVEHAHQIVLSGHDQHAYMDDFSLTEHIGYLITDDLAVGIGAGYRHLRKQNVDDPDHLGEHDFSSGATDPQFDIKYRFKRQTDCFPLDMAVFASVKTPFGRTHNRLPEGDFFETEDQPGTGSWNGTLGLAASRGWGKWGASLSGSYTYKGEGAQHFKEGDVGRVSVSASRLVSPEACAWKLYTSFGLQGLVENKAQEDGVKDPDHGGQFIYILPGIAAKPTERLVVSLTAPIPVYQEENGTHQKQNYSIQLGVGVRF